MKKSLVIDELIGKVNKLTFKSSPKFVVNPIIYVDGEEDEDSSDEEYDSEDEDEFDKLDESLNKDNLPFKTFKVTKSKAKKTMDQDKISKPVGILKLMAPDQEIEELNGVAPKSVIAQSFLNKLYKTGLEAPDSSEKIEDVVTVSMLLNRPLSISTRKNNLLLNELNSITESPIAHAKSGVFWHFPWYDDNNKIIDYKIVKTYYKKLKRYDSDKGTTKAEQFKNLAEKGIAVPYQELRERAKNHENTKALVRNLRNNNPDADIYMSFVDGDTKSFNGIYSAYLRIYQKSKVIPTLMSTGYEFTKEQEGDYPIVEGCKVDRQIRIATAKYLPWSVYYPEPNFCVLIIKGNDVLHESFIDTSIKLGSVIIKNAESAALIRHLLISRDKTILVAIFANDNPLLTAIPIRVRLIKGASKEAIKFSDEFTQGFAPTLHDITLFKQMSQSHMHESVWLDNLYLNRGIIIKGNFFEFKGLITKYLNSSITTVELYSLLNFASNETLINIKKAYEARQKTIETYKTENLKTTEVIELYNYIKYTLEQELTDFENEFLKTVIQANVLWFLKNKILDLNELSDLSPQVLEGILSYESLELLEDKKYTFEEILKVHLECIEDNMMELENVDISLEELMSLVLHNKKEYDALNSKAGLSISQIIKIYKEGENVLSIFSKGNILNFIRQYKNKMDIDKILEIYSENNELFYAMIEDEMDIINQIGLRNFINKFEVAQKIRDKNFTEDPESYYDYENTNIYDNIYTDHIEDQCPAELLGLGNESD